MIMVSLTLLGLYSLLDFEEDSWIPSHLPWKERPPPLYPKYRLRELALPQHNLDLPYPEGKDGKYLWISEHVHGMSHSTSTPLQPGFYVPNFFLNRLRVGQRFAGTLRQCFACISFTQSVSLLLSFIPASQTYTSVPSFVFDNYTWEREGPPYSRFNGKLIPSTIPMTVQIAGTSHNITHPLLQIHAPSQGLWPAAPFCRGTILRDPS